MNRNPSAFTIGTLSREGDCGVDTIRYYERRGLMPQVARSPGGHRLYRDAHLRRLRLIRRSRALGLSLEQIRTIIEGAEQNALGCDRARELLSAQIQTVRARILEFRRLERNLNRMLAACADATSRNCHVLETALADEKPLAGARCCPTPAAGERGEEHALCRSRTGNGTGAGIRGRG